MAQHTLRISGLPRGRAVALPLDDDSRVLIELDGKPAVELVLDETLDEDRITVVGV